MHSTPKAVQTTIIAITSRVPAKASVPLVLYCVFVVLRFLAKQCVENELREALATRKTKNWIQKDFPMLQTPVRCRLNNRREKQFAADEIRGATLREMREHGRILNELIARVETSWKQVEHLLDTQNMLRYELTQALDELYFWLHECFCQIFYSDYSLNVRVDSDNRIIPGRIEPQLLHEVCRLYNLAARILHRMQQEWTGPDPANPQAQRPATIDADRHIAEMNYTLAQYAELVAGGCRGSLGPINDDRYHHPDRRKWTEIHMRTKRRLANMARRWADEDVRLLAQYDQARGF